MRLCNAAPHKCRREVLQVNGATMEHLIKYMEYHSVPGRSDKVG